MYRENRKDGNTPDGWARILASDPLAQLKLRIDPRWRVIRRHLEGPILDAGCGRGDWVAFLKRNGYQVTGIDYSDEMTQFNRKLHPGKEFFSGRIQQMPFADNTFGSVVSWGVIEHEEAGPHMALEEFRRVLRPGGRILVTVPVDNPAQRAASQVNFSDEGRFFQYFFTQLELAEHVREAGFLVLQTDYSGRPSPALVWPQRYSAAGPLEKRILQLVALCASRDKANMIHCLAEKQK